MVIQCSNIRHVPGEVLKTAAFGPYIRKHINEVTQENTRLRNTAFPRRQKDMR